MHASVSRVAGSASTLVRPLSSNTRWNSCGPSPARVPVQTELYGFIRSAVEERGRSCRNASISCQRGSTFSMPITEISTRGRVTHMRPLPSDSKITTEPVSAMAKLAPLIAKGTVRNFSRRYRRAAPARSEGVSVRSSVPASWRLKISRISARLRWMAGTRMCEVIIPELDDDLGQVCLDGPDTLGRKGRVKANLVCGERFDLDHL